MTEIKAGWTVDDVLDYVQDVCPAVEEDNEGQLVLYTGLYQTPDGGLTDTSPEPAIPGS